MPFTGRGGSAVNRRTRIALLRSLVPLAIMGTIFYFSAQPGIDHHGWFVVLLRKLGHVTEYALLTAAWWWTLRMVTRRPLPSAIGISLAYACTDEFHQTLVHGRDGTPRDIVIDAIGMTIAALLITRWRPRRASRTGPRSSPVPSP
jgi:VanZ family protein